MIWLLTHWWMLVVAALVFGVSLARLIGVADEPHEVGGVDSLGGTRRQPVDAADTFPDGDTA